MIQLKSALLHPPLSLSFCIAFCSYFWLFPINTIIYKSSSNLRMVCLTPVVPLRWRQISQVPVTCWQDLSLRNPGNHSYQRTTRIIKSTYINKKMSIKIIYVYWKWKQNYIQYCKLNHQKKKDASFINKCKSLYLSIQPANTHCHAVWKYDSLLFKSYHVNSIL